jgi:hypothetical protein
VSENLAIHLSPSNIRQHSTTYFVLAIPCANRDHPTRDRCAYAGSLHEHPHHNTHNRDRSDSVDNKQARNISRHQEIRSTRIVLSFDNADRLSCSRAIAAYTNYAQAKNKSRTQKRF